VIVRARVRGEVWVRISVRGWVRDCGNDLVRNNAQSRPKMPKIPSPSGCPYTKN
jgi:hypothetical protein